MHSIGIPATSNAFKVACVDDNTVAAQVASLRSDRLAHPTERRVLVVDDEVRVADTVAEILADSGYAAVAAYSGNAALEHARAKCPDILMCDVLMPDMNGIQTAVAIREICPGARVLLFSGHAAVSDMLERARVEGHEFEFVQKPIRPEDLLRKLDT